MSTWTVQRLLNVTLLSLQASDIVCLNHQTATSYCSFRMLIVLLLILTAQLVPAATMSDQRTSADAQQGIPAITDPAAVDQDQYGKMAQGASLGAGSGAALGESGQSLARTGGHAMHCFAATNALCLRHAARDWEYLKHYIYTNAPCTCSLCSISCAEDLR
jgi:hypothetical protein